MEAGTIVRRSLDSGQERGGNGSETLKQCLSTEWATKSYSLLSMAMRTPNGVVLMESYNVPRRIPVG